MTEIFLVEPILEQIFILDTSKKSKAWLADVNDLINRMFQS